MNKKAVQATETSLLELIGMILGLVLLVGSAVIVMSYFGGGIRTGEERTVIVNFESLVNTVNQLLNDGQDFSVERNMPYFIGTDYILAGFNEKETMAVDKCGTASEQIPRPLICGSSSACLCIYRNGVGNDFGEGQDPPIICRNFAANELITFEYFSSRATTPAGGALTQPQLYSNIGKIQEAIYKNVIGEKWRPSSLTTAFFPPDKKYARVLIYGKCDFWAIETAFGTQTLYVEKIQKQGKTLVFIAPETELTKQRYSQLLELFASYETARKALLDGNYREAILIIDRTLYKLRQAPEDFWKYYYVLAQALEGMLTYEDDTIVKEMNTIFPEGIRQTRYLNAFEFQIPQQSKPREHVALQVRLAYEKAAELYKDEFSNAPEKLIPKIKEKQKQATGEFLTELQKIKTAGLSPKEEAEKANTVREKLFQQVISRKHLTEEYYAAFTALSESYLTHYSFVVSDKRLPIGTPGINYVTAVSYYKALNSLFPSKKQEISEKISTLCSRPIDEEHAKDWDEQKEEIAKLCVEV